MHRFVLVFALLVLALGAMLLVLLSPLALASLDSRVAADWDRLSSIGETYGAASALLAILALGGVLLSLVLQARESKANREQSLRVLHVELLRMAMDDELYLACWGPFGSHPDRDSQRQHMYVNLVVSHWQLMYEIDSLREPQLRAMADSLFSGDVGYRFWSDVRAVRLRTATGRRATRFHRIVDERFVATTPPVPTRQEAPDRVRSRSTGRARTVLASIGVAIGLGGAASIARRRLRRRSRNSKGR